MKKVLLSFLFLILFSTFYFLNYGSVFAQPSYTIPGLPPGPTLSQGGILGILISFANFLIAAGVILAIIAIVVSGIMYFTAGSDTEAKKAKGWFRNGIIGAFIILGVGVIIWTIYNIVVTGSFFGGAPGAGFPGGVKVGNSCTGDAQCSPPESFCNAATEICRRTGGNLAGENCKAPIDCATGLICKGGGPFGIGQEICQP